MGRHGPAAAPPVQADARQAGPHDPRRRRLAVRAEVGRVPLHRVPRRRRDRAGQPQRAAVHPLLPRAARPAARDAPRAVRRRRRDRRPRPGRPRARLRRPAPAHPPRRVARSPPGRRDPGLVRRLRPAGPRRRRRCSSGRSASAGSALLEAVTPGAGRSTSRRRAPTAEIAADWFGRFEGAGLDGVVAKRLDDPYQPDKRALVKVKHERTADCVVAGYRIHKDGEGVGSLLLGLYDDKDRLQHVGVAAVVHRRLPPPAARRAASRSPTTPLDDHPWRDWAEWQQARTSAASPGATSRWNAGKDLSWVADPSAETGRRGDVRPAGEPPLPPRRLVRPLAPGPRAVELPLRPARGRRPGPLRRARRPTTRSRPPIERRAVVPHTVGRLRGG